MLYVFTVIVALLFGIVTKIALHSRHHKRHQSGNSLLSSTGIVDTTLNPQGSVLVRGELWLARSASGSLIPAQSKVTVVGFQDHLLLVAPA